MLTDSGLAGKAIIGTGGSRGIGRAVVEIFYAEGADVTFLFREDTAAEVVYAVWFLAFRSADYITGEVLHVDGSFKME